MGSNATISGPEDRLDKRIVLLINGRERLALARVARDMQLSEKECIRSLILAATLDLKPKPKKVSL
jgi:hypothetical protein